MSENAWIDPFSPDAVAAGANDAACVAYPGRYQRKTRKAFCDGAAHVAATLPRMTETEALELADYDGETIVEVMREWGFIKPTESPSA